MEFNITTTDLQRLIIALIFAGTDPLCTFSEDVTHPMIDKFCELNKLCNRENDFTLRVTVSGKKKEA